MCFASIVRMGLVQKVVDHLAAIDDGEVSIAELHVACILPRVQKGSHDDHFKVRLDHVPHSKRLRDSIQFIQLESFAPPGVRERLERDVQTDLVPEAKALGDRAREAVDANRLSLDAMLLDSKLEHGRRDVDDSERRRRKTRHARAARNGDPHLGGKLSSDVMEAQSGDKTHHRTRKGGGGDGEIVVFSRSFQPGQSIASWTDLFERAGPRHSSQRASVDALTSYVAGPQNVLLLGKTEDACSSASTLCRLAYTH